ncbi:hypothetical protein P152DRAFT_435944 [Eremomyces bilateralis CBS 781.70]|uniref:Signal recognition particle subunit SRP72 n=1 Tax=Eremomyces bilateralis CBS 781.70 TaxID=1392243 RepID=A0A6G1G3S6_9PEZI|nr:uncharacterized protein P152DRAFT_435944 [Eremomyces bilateralis CBS 781.70]KAF1812632.1 hypothetical protein P152DRAFT_435944 [Eremomyces bilateralis CBS 781.70]
MSKDSLAALLGAISLEDHEQTVKLAENLLKKSSSDAKVQRARIVALLNLDRYEEAIQAIEKASRSFQQDCSLEYSYALYRCGRLQDAINIAGDKGSEGSKHLLAQTHYRLEAFENSAALYKELASQSNLDEDEVNDIVINRGAVNAQLAWKGRDDISLGLDEGAGLESFEASFNEACACLGRGELARGEALLKKAQELCLSSSILTSQEKSVEVLQIMEQKVFALLRVGKVAEAKNLALAVTSKDVFDPSLRMISQINLTIVESSDSKENPFIVHRKLHEKTKLPALQEPFGFQSSVILKNRLIANSLVQKGKEAGYLSGSDREGLSSFLAAAAGIEGKTNSKVIETLLPRLNKSPKDLGVAFLVAQLYVEIKNHDQAIVILEKLVHALEKSGTPNDSEIRFAPGLVGLLTNLYHHAGRPKSRRAEFANYARHIQSTQSLSSAPLPLLLTAGAALLESWDRDDLVLAAHLFSAAHETHPTSRAATVGQSAAAAALSSTTPSASSALRPISALIADISTASLEAAGVPLTKAPIATKRARDEKPTTKATKRIRPSRMPKEFVEGKVMDTERWLPLRDRSYWKPKGRKGKKKAEGLTQGGVEDEGGQQGGGQAGSVVVGGGGGGKKKGKKGKR